MIPWFPVKAYRPCPSFVAAKYKYDRAGQSLDEVSTTASQNSAFCRTVSWCGLITAFPARGLIRGPLMVLDIRCVFARPGYPVILVSRNAQARLSPVSVKDGSEGEGTCR